VQVRKPSGSWLGLGFRLKQGPDIGPGTDLLQCWDMDDSRLLETEDGPEALTHQTPRVAAMLNLLPAYENLLILGLACLPLIAIVASLTRVSRWKFARLRDEVKQLSDRVKTIEIAEQRRFMMEFKSNGASAAPSTGATADGLTSQNDPTRLQ
jgi:hypothetical protein